MEISAISRLGIDLQTQSHELLLQHFAHGTESTPDQVLDRVAKGLASIEVNPFEWEPIFRKALQSCVLSDRINALAGLDNCDATWVEGFIQPLADSICESTNGVPSIMDAAMQAAQTMNLGGTVGYDFSVLRPKGSWVQKNQSFSCGPISYMGIFSSMYASFMAGENTREPQMAVLRCDHPDILDFLRSSDTETETTAGTHQALSNFNLRVGVTDALMLAVLKDSSFDLVHAAQPSPIQKAAGAVQRGDGLWIYKTVRAAHLFEQIIRASTSLSEMGVLFVDRIAEENNLRAPLKKAGCNVGASQALQPYESRTSGQVLLALFVENAAWEGTPVFNFDKLEQVVSTMVRMLDNALDLTPWPTPEHRLQALNERRMGIGFAGLADALILMGLKYSSKEGRTFATKVGHVIRSAAYTASIELALERGSFPIFNADQYLEGVGPDHEGTFASGLPKAIKDLIAVHGIRNSHLVSLAPVNFGPRSFGNNCSSGAQPVRCFTEKPLPVHSTGYAGTEEGMVNYAYLQYRAMGGDTANLPGYFEASQSLDVSAHVEMLKALTPYIDGALQEAVAVPETYATEDLQCVYMEAWSCGLKCFSLQYLTDPVDGISAVQAPETGVEVKQDTCLCR